MICFETNIRKWQLRYWLAEMTHRSAQKEEALRRVCAMFDQVSEWLDDVLENDIPIEVVAFGFNLYDDDGDYNWSMELVGTSEFDMDDEDWLCDEVTDFDTRDNPFRWTKEAGWEEVFDDIVSVLRKYLKSGKFADVLKAKSGIGVGFVDGDVEILYTKKTITSWGNIQMDYKIVRLADRPEIKEKAAKWFHEKWKVPLEAYLESMEDCLTGNKVVPQWYLAMEGQKMIGGLGVIENDFHNRKDLTPNVCAVYVEKDNRCRGIAGALLRYVCDDMKEKGIDTLYLVTDHTSFYERYGWEFLCMVQGDGETELTRMYIHKEQ